MRVFIMRLLQLDRSTTPTGATDEPKGVCVNWMRLVAASFTNFIW